jgi:tetratricopeptide (TPR) repeat protein
MPKIMSRFMLFLMLCLSVVAARAGESRNGATQEAASTGTTAQATKPEGKPSVDGGTTDYSKEPFVTEQMKVRFRFENDGTGRTEQALRIRVQSEAGVQRWGQLRFGYNAASENFEIVYVRVIKLDGSVVTAGADAVQELNEPVQRIAPVYTDYREKHVTVPGLRPGDVLECETVTVIHSPLAPGQFWMQHEFQENSVVLDEQLEIDLPAARAVKLKTKPGMEPKITEEKGRRLYRWSSSHLVTDQDEKKGADTEKKKKKKKSEDEVPAVQLTSFASWEELGRWYGGLEKDRRIPSKAVRAKAEELTKGLSTEIAKVEALYDFTAKNFRYVSLSLGMGRYQPHSAEEVLHNQYGDCKDKNTLLASLLEAEGIRASSVLINSARKLDPDVPSPAQFDHVITMVPMGKDEVWMDTTTEVAPFRLLSYSLRKKQALVIPPDGAPHLEETPADSPMPDTEKLQIEGKVSDAGKLDARIAYEIRGDSEILIRQAFRSVASSQWQGVIEGMSSKEGLGKEVSEVNISDPAATRDPFTFSYRVAKGDYLDQSKKKLGLKLPLAVAGLAAADPDEADSPDPIELGPRNSSDYQIRLEFPSKYNLQAPVGFTLKRDYGSYEATYKLDGNVLTAERKLAMSESKLPSSRVQDYLAFRRAVGTDLMQVLSLETTVAASPTSSTETKPEDLIRRGNAERKNGNYSLAIDLLNRAVEADPKSKGAWNDLGLAYLDSRLDGLAINAFQKQIEVNPYDAYAYNNLGRVFLRQRKYEEAAKSFNKQIEIDPLDKFAHANLGTVFMEQHKYADAVPELERAASLTPDSAGAQVRLGEAYLNLDQDEKAMLAYDKAVKIAATPGIWNSIAYQLTLKKAHLDVAQRYAESAVISTEAALRNLSLDGLTTQQVALTARLADYWDTLGWVWFMSGNLDKAERYVLAAWQVGQNSAVADHLGQIYEKRGDKERAVDYYALAMNARRPEVEIRGRLAALAGADKVDAIVEKSQSELIEQRTIKLGNTPKQAGKAEFFFLLSNGPHSEMAVEGVKFASGDPQLKSFTDAVRTARYIQTLPDDTAVKILRRGTLSCTAAASDCTFVLVLPEDVRSVD